MEDFSGRENIDTLSKPLAHRLSAMMQAVLLTYREFIPWADALIIEMEAPPNWVLDLAVTKYRPRAIEIVNGYAHSAPFEHLSLDTWADEYVSSVWLRHERRELSWATALEMAGRMADANGGRHPCEYCYKMLNELEEAEFAQQLEAAQRSAVLPEYENVIASVRRTFEGIRRFRNQKQ